MKSAAVLISLALFFSSASFAQSNPVPQIDLPLVPTSAAPRGPSFVLTINGTGFVSGAAVKWNGKTLATKFVSQTQLTATVPAADIAEAGTALVAVSNPGMIVASNVGFFSITTPVSSPAFDGINAPTLGNPVYTAVADFNKDGILDLAVGNYTLTNSVAIFLGNGDGTFKPPVLYTSGQLTHQIAVGDFNGDGNLDLATADYYSNTVSILLGKGDGTFGPARSYPTSENTYYISTGDFNRDGKLDLVATSFSAGITLFFGNGDGTFRTGTTTKGGSDGLCTGDFNGDGILDLATADENDVGIFLGNGDGTFHAGSFYQGGTAEQSITCTDVNGDGALDVVTGNWDGGTVLLGVGDGTLGPPENYITQVGYNVATVADLNGDGKIDIALANESSDTLAIFLGNGDGTFQQPSYFQGGMLPEAVTFADFNGDGAMDLLVSSFGYPTDSGAFVAFQTTGPSVLLSKKIVSFPKQLARSQSAPQTITATNVGRADLLVTNVRVSGNNATSFTQTSNCKGTLAPGASCDLNVTFVPQNRGPLAGIMILSDNAMARQQTVYLSGIGEWASLTPAGLTFSEQKIGTTSPPQTVTLTNVGQESFSIRRIRVVGGHPIQFTQNNNCGSSLSAGASCTINVFFLPTQKGRLQDVLQVEDNGGGSEQKTLLSGEGIE
ncbi:MAG: FG-GAP-like repeat-containing protein [Candidatus Sulfotelmatobacter sp.]